MHMPAIQANPFALLMDPESVFRALETSTRLDGLQRRVCRPLDKPQLAQRADVEFDDLDDGIDGIERVGDSEHWS